MKTFTTIAALAAVVSTSYAATVKLQETACIQNNTSLESFDVQIGTLLVKDLPSVCGLKLVSADGADLNAINCQAYKDAAGTQPGSAKFNVSSPALIATNPVQEGSILCTVGETTTPTATLVVSVSATGGATPSGNATVPSVTAPTAPSGTSTTTSAPTGAAGKVGMSVGALAAAFAVLML